MAIALDINVLKHVSLSLHFLYLLFVFTGQCLRVSGFFRYASNAADYRNTLTSVTAMYLFIHYQIIREVQISERKNIYRIVCTSLTVRSYFRI